MKNLLALDTSSPVLSVALKSGSRNISETKMVGFLRHAENLMPIIDRLLKKHKITIRDIDAFLVNRGPGSFTGLRIAFATLKGFLVIDPKPCFGASSIDMIAANINLPERSVLSVALDARRDQFYARTYHCENGAWAPQTGILIYHPKDWIHSLPAECRVAGDAISRAEDLIKNCGKKIHVLPQTSWYPKASALIRALESYGQKTGFAPLTQLSKPDDFLPLYFRLSEAEEKNKYAVCP